MTAEIESPRFSGNVLHEDEQVCHPKCYPFPVLDISIRRRLVEKVLNFGLRNVEWWRTGRKVGCCLKAFGDHGSCLKPPTQIHQTNRKNRQVESNVYSPVQRPSSKKQTERKRERVKWREFELPEPK